MKSTNTNLNITHILKDAARHDKTTRSRDPLSNITNAKKSDHSKKDNNPHKSNKEKDPSTTDRQPTDKDSKQSKNKKKKSEPLPEEVLLAYENIDLNDFDDPQSVADYVNDIYEYLMIKEKDRVDYDYLISQIQTEINEKMRAILVDWLVEVHRMFKLLPETLFLCVMILDKYLLKTNLPR